MTVGGDTDTGVRLRHDGARRAFELARGVFAVYRHDESVTQSAGRLQVTDMADVQDVETAIGKDQFLARVAQAGAFCV